MASDQHIEATAIGQGYYRVFVYGEQRSQHIAEREAMEAASKWKRDEPTADVYYDHDYHVRIDLVDKPVVVTPPPEPEPPIVVPPVDPPPTPTGRITASRLRLVGGWRIKQPFCKGGMAIDFDSMKAYIGGHANQNDVCVFSLPSMGEGGDISSWPIVDFSSKVSPFWDAGDVRGLMVRDGKLWASPKVFYDTSPQNVTLRSRDLATGVVESLPVPLKKPAFGGGFIKGDPSRFLIGCGGYSSGQGSVAGPTCATADGAVLLRQANHGSLVFGSRELRPPNYSTPNNEDSWVALSPRDGVGQWAADRVYGGGVWRPDGLMYWPILGVNDLDYSRQSETFASTTQSWFYTYDPASFDQVAFEPWPHGEVNGQDVGPDGRIYLLTRNAWKSQMYLVDPVVKVFEVVQ